MSVRPKTIQQLAMDCNSAAACDSTTDDNAGGGAMSVTAATSEEVHDLLPLPALQTSRMDFSDWPGEAGSSSRSPGVAVAANRQDNEDPVGSPGGPSHRRSMRRQTARTFAAVFGRLEGRGESMMLAPQSSQQSLPATANSTAEQDTETPASSQVKANERSKEDEDDAARLGFVLKGMKGAARTVALATVANLARVDATIGNLAETVKNQLADVVKVTGEVSKATDSFVAKQKESQERRERSLAADPTFRRLSAELRTKCLARRRGQETISIGDRRSQRIGQDTQNTPHVERCKLNTGSRHFRVKLCRHSASHRIACCLMLLNGETPQATEDARHESRARTVDLWCE
jgi:hypothetical protein